MDRWLTDDEQRAWRGLIQMTSRLDARLNRELQQSSGLSLADYDVLVLLTEAADGRLRVFEIAEELHWEQSRLSHHLARMQRRRRAYFPPGSVTAVVRHGPRVRSTGVRQIGAVSGARALRNVPVDAD